MSARYDEEWIASLLDVEKRLGDTTPEQCLATAGMQPGHTVVDYGCGPGLFTFPAAQIAGPDGTVYAVDIEPRMVTLIERKAGERGAGNVTAVLNDGQGAPLPPDTADFLVLGQVLHYPEETEGRVAMARDVARLLKPDGRALVIEWTPEDESSSRMGPGDVESIVGEAGLRVEPPQPLGPRQYMMIATHRPSTAG